MEPLDLRLRGRFLPGLPGVFPDKTLSSLMLEISGQIIPAIFNGKSKIRYSDIVSPYAGNLPAV